MEDFTLQAYDEVDDVDIYFTDYGYEGDQITLWEDAEVQEGFLGMRVLYHDGDSWRLRKLTDEEEGARMERILGSIRFED